MTAVWVTIAMSVIGSPRARSTNGTATLAKPTVIPNGSMSSAQRGGGKKRRVGLSATPRL